MDATTIFILIVTCGLAIAAGIAYLALWWIEH